MKTKYGHPPNYEEICHYIPAVRKQPNVIFTYGDVIYVPQRGRPLPYHLMVHETTHRYQHEEAGGPELWWSRYLRDKEFRLDQEVKCYRRQWGAMTSRERQEHLHGIAKDLSGPMYGNLVTYEEAVDLITKP